MKFAYFDSNQDPKRDEPRKFVELEEARAMKKAGTHYFGNNGHAIVEVPQVAKQMAACERGTVDVDGRKMKVRGNWLIVGQTKKPRFPGFLESNGPGFPHYSFV